MRIRLDWVLLLLPILLCACGDDDGDDDTVPQPDAAAVVVDASQSDALVVMGDVTCLGSLPQTVDTTLTIGASLYDVTANNGNQATAVNGATVKIVRNSDGMVLDTAGTGVAGDFTVSFMTSGVPFATHNEVTAPGLLPSRNYYNVPSSVSFDGWTIFAAGQARADRIAAAQGVTIDPQKGIVEIAVDDCAFGGLPNATVTLSSKPDAMWAMQSSGGIWIERATTFDSGLGWTASLAAAVNVEPGLATLDVSIGDLHYPPVEIDVQPGTWTWVYVRPGQ